MYSSFVTSGMKTDDATYVRAEETTESREVIDQVQTWEDTSQQGISKLMKLARDHSSSVGVQEALLQKIGALCFEKKDENGAGVAGLAPKAMVTLVVRTADGLREDAKLQEAAITALRNLAIVSRLDAVMENDGVRVVVSALQQHKANKDVCLAGVSLIHLLISKSKQHSPEWAVLCDAGTENVLRELLPFHPDDPRVEKMVKTAIPFLQG